MYLQHKKQMHKSDPIDSHNLGRSLRVNEVKGIYISGDQTLGIGH
ncbi:hypothetical protein FHX64_000335 [Microbacter margulisiae]|uniref:Uncharacterized protein n=1 Tax=Microbacter margulisiae TaxID=1350067 RepID=A0A7W5DNP9_9PORP|nr:hypothetical protein [Microbacter margulisiae]